MINNKLYGWDGSIKWQDDFKRSSTSYSQSYIVSMAKFEIPPIDIISPDLKYLPTNMRAQTLNIEQVSSTILKVNVSYGYGNTVDPEEDDTDDPTVPPDEKEKKQEKMVKSITSTTNTTAKLENILAHPDFRKDVSSKEDKAKFALLANGTIIKKQNGLYGYAKESYNVEGTISQPTSGNEFWKQIEEGVNTFVYSDINTTYTIRTKYPTGYLKLINAVADKSYKLPLIFKLQDHENRDWMCDNVSYAYESGGIYTITVGFKLSNYGGWNEKLYSKQEN